MDNKKMLLKSLGEVLHRLRKEKKLSQEQLGVMAGTSSMTVKRLESATAGTRVDNLMAITQVLGISLAELFREVEGYEHTDNRISDPTMNKMVNAINKLTSSEREWLSKQVDIVLENPWKPNNCRENEHNVAGK